MILKNRVIVFLGNMRSDGPIKATSLFIARNLAKDNKVFFIDYPFTLKDYFKYIKADGAKERKEKFSIFSDGIIDTDLPNLKIVITPPVFPINFMPEGWMFRTLLKVNEDLIAMRIKKVFKKLHIKDFIYINSFNFHYPGIAKKIKPKYTVYQCVDPMIIPYDLKHGIKSEDQLIKSSDMVICTSKALFEEKKVQNSNTYFVPNGADPNYGIVPLPNKMLKHPKLQGITGPIIGYLGTIERRIDYDLLEAVIQDNTDKTFVLAGPTDHNYTPSSLSKWPNVMLLGTINYEEVPQIINSFDVAIIPFKKDRVSNTIFPIKLFEYLSLGKPVVMTDFNTDLKEYTGDLVEYCCDQKSFSKSLNDALLNDNEELTLKRMNLAKSNTWEKRANAISSIIQSHL